MTIKRSCLNIAILLVSRISEVLIMWDSNVQCTVLDLATFLLQYVRSQPCRSVTRWQLAHSNKAKRGAPWPTFTACWNALCEPGHVQIVVSLWLCMHHVGLSLKLSCSLCGTLWSFALTIAEQIFERPGPWLEGASFTLGKE